MQVSNSVFQVGVHYNSSGVPHHAIQFIVSFPSVLEPGVPMAGYALLANGQKAFNVFSSRISANRLKVIIVPERMMSNILSPLNSGYLVNIPFRVKTLAEGVKNDVLVSLSGRSNIIISNKNGFATGSVNIGNSARITVSSYATCKDINGLAYYVADAKYADGSDISLLGLTLPSLSKSDINNDGICDQAAIEGGLDSDDDGISDAEELAYDFLNPYDPSDAELDFDGDGLTNVYEIANGILPDVNNVADTDNDGMNDLFELKNGLNPLDNADRNSDRDNDKLSNYLEYINGSDPNLKDTDGDGMADGFEYQYGFPFVVVGVDGLNNGNVCTTNQSRHTNGTGPIDDKDCDGLTNIVEHGLASNPLLPDTDGDNVADLAEYNNGRSVVVNEAVLITIINGLLLN